MIPEISGYFLAAIYRLKFSRLSPFIQYLYFISCGFGLIIFNYGKFSFSGFYFLRNWTFFFHLGWDVYHSMIGIVGAYLICKFLGGKSISIVVAFIFFMVRISHFWVRFWAFWSSFSWKIFKIFTFLSLNLRNFLKLDSKLHYLLGTLISRLLFHRYRFLWYFVDDAAVYIGHALDWSCAGYLWRSSY